MIDSMPEPAVLDASLVQPADGERSHRQKRICLAVFYAAAILAGIAHGLTQITSANLADLVLSGMTAFAVLFWVQADASENDTRVGPRLRLMILVLMPLGFAIYCLTRRRFRTLLLGIAAFLGFIAVAGIAYYFTSTLALPA